MHDIGKAPECFNLGGRRPGQRFECRDDGDMLAVLNGPRDSLGEWVASEAYPTTRRHHAAPLVSRRP